MNTQINLRIPEKLLKSAKSYSDKNGFGNVQEFIKELLREKIFKEQDITKHEFFLLSKLVQASEKNNLYGTENELFKKLNTK